MLFLKYAKTFFAYYIYIYHFVSFINYQNKIGSRALKSLRTAVLTLPQLECEFFFTKKRSPHGGLQAYLAIRRAEQQGSRPVSGNLPQKGRTWSRARKKDDCFTFFSLSLLFLRGWEFPRASCARRVGYQLRLLATSEKDADKKSFLGDLLRRCTEKTNSRGEQKIVSCFKGTTYWGISHVY